MSTINDARVLDLKEKIEKMEKGLIKPTFSPKTNCNLLLDDKRYNLHILNKETLTYLLVRLNVYVMSAKDLNIPTTDVKINGFILDDWIEDIKGRMFMLEYKKKEELLENKKQELQKLLSEDKRTELALDDIEKELGLL